MDIINFLGVAGLLMILTAFALNLFKKIESEKVTYNILNFVGGCFLAIYSWALGSIPFLILQTVWAGFALYKLTQILLK